MSIAETSIWACSRKLRGSRSAVSQARSATRSASTGSKRSTSRRSARRAGHRTLRRQPAEGGRRQGAGPEARADHLRRADARRRRRRHRRDPPAHQPARRRRHRGDGHLVLPAGDPGAVRPHPGRRQGRIVEEFAGHKATRKRSCTRRSTERLRHGHRHALPSADTLQRRHRPLPRRRSTSTSTSSPATATSRACASRRLPRATGAACAGTACCSAWR